MNTMKFGATAALAIAALTACSTPPVNRVADQPLQAVERVDLSRYAGRWYEIARFPNGFEEGCEGVTADYRLRADGLVDVVNTCRKDSPDGKIEQAKGRARPAEEGATSRLKVSFFGPFWGDYWVIGLTDDYSLSLVGEPEGRYLWILARTPTISDEVRTSALERLTALGYNVEALYFPQQPPVPDNPDPFN